MHLCIHPSIYMKDDDSTGFPGVFQAGWKNVISLVLSMAPFHNFQGDSVWFQSTHIKPVRRYGWISGVLICDIWFLWRCSTNPPDITGNPPQIHKGLIFGLVKGNPWFFISPDHKASYFQGGMLGRVGWLAITIISREIRFCIRDWYPVDPRVEGWDFYCRRWWSTPVWGPTNHGYSPLTNWDDPLSTPH